MEMVVKLKEIEVTDLSEDSFNIFKKLREDGYVFIKGTTITPSFACITVVKGVKARAEQYREPVNNTVILE